MDETTNENSGVTKKEVLDFWTKHYKMMHKTIDIPTAWNKYITSLLSRGIITERQHINWTDYFKKGKK